MRSLRFIVLAGIALVTALASACGGGGDSSPFPAEGKLPVVATTVQVGALAREVGGGLVDLRVLIRPGVDPHDFELKAGDRKTIDTARVILENGAGLDAVVESATSSARNRGKVTVVSLGIALRMAEGGEPDPHVWHSPPNAKVMVDNIVAALAQADAANAEVYRANGEAYKATLDETDAQVRALIDSIPPGNRRMVTNHDAFGYFIERYGLTLVGTVIPGASTQAEPSARAIAALIDTIRREEVRAIFSEESIDPKVASQVARDTGVKIVDDLYGDTLGEPGTEAATVHGMLLVNARKIAEALR